MKHLSVLSGRSSAIQDSNSHEQFALPEVGLFHTPRLTDTYIFEEGKESFLFDTCSCALIAVDELVTKIIQLSATKTNDQIVSILSDKFPIIDIHQAFSELRVLEQRGFLQNQLETKLSFYIDINDVPRVPITNIVLSLTNKCNLSCKYCYQQREQPSSVGDMSKKVAASAVDWLLDKSSSAERVGIKFFGGEPLLNRPVMKFVLEYATEQAQKYNKSAHFSLITNGTLLTKDIVEFIRKYDIGTCVSIDGPQQLHDANRCYRNGRGSFTNAHRRVIKLLEDCSHLTMAQATLTKQSVNKMKEVIRFVHTMGFHSLYIGFVHGDDNDDNATCGDYFDSLKDNYVSLLADCILEAGTFRINLGRHDDILNRIYNGIQFYHGCPSQVGINRFHVDSEGNIYPCSRLLTSDFWLGNLLHGIEDNRVNHIRQRFINDYVDINDCKECWARYLCGGRCPAEKYQRAGGFHHTTCQVREFIALDLRLYVLLWRKNRSLVDRLYGSGDTTWTN